MCSYFPHLPSSSHLLSHSTLKVFTKIISNINTTVSRIFLAGFPSLSVCCSVSICFVLMLHLCCLVKIQHLCNYCRPPAPYLFVPFSSKTTLTSPLSTLFMLQSLYQLAGSVFKRIFVYAITHFALDYSLLMKLRLHATY